MLWVLGLVVTVAWGVLCVGAAHSSLPLSARERMRLHSPLINAGRRAPGERLDSKDWAQPGKASGTGVAQAGTDSLDEPGCACYRVRNSFCCWQALCVCQHVCYNGSALLGSFPRTPPCLEAGLPLPWPHSPFGRKDAPLKAVPCRKTSRFKHHLGIALKEAPIPHGLDYRPSGWQRTRHAITWRDGTTYLQPLGVSCSSIAHFWGKVAQLLLINNASNVAPGLPYFVDRFLLPRDGALQKSMEEAGSSSWHANILSQLLKLAARPLLPGQQHTQKTALDNDFYLDDLEPQRLSSVFPLLGGIVEFESAFLQASEQEPMCFDRLVLPGYLKANFFPGGVAEGLWFKEKVWRSLGLEVPLSPLLSQGEEEVEGAGNSSTKASARTKPIQVLYIARRGSRRTLQAQSETSLLDILNGLNFEVQQVDFSTLSFHQQLQHIATAEIILGLHGAALTNAAFAMNRSVVLEIFPYRVFHYGYYFSSISSGVTYMMHQCRQGDPQAHDAEFKSLSLRTCLNTPRCKQYFTHDRPVQLTRADLKDIRHLLKEAKQFVMDARWNLKRAGKKLLKRFDSLCETRERDIRCRLDLIRSPVASMDVECVVKKDCKGVKLRGNAPRDEIL